MTGSGTSTNPYMIYNLSDLDLVRNYLTKSGVYFKLANDIDCSITSQSTYNSGKGFNVIGDDTTSGKFMGVLDGSGYRILNLTINQPTRDNVGLFGAISSSTIKNLGLENCNIIGNNYSGCISGNAYNATIIQNCYVTGRLVCLDSMAVGGLLGYINPSSGANVVNCFTMLSISNPTAKDDLCGGICGTSGMNISNSYTANTYDSSKCVPIVASSGLTTACYYDSTLYKPAVTPTNATALSTAQMKTQSSYVGWDFVNTWTIDNTGVINSGYPYLKVFNKTSAQPTINITNIEWQPILPCNINGTVLLKVTVNEG